jgi:membrane protease YdiL (CAAX protease family)
MVRIWRVEEAGMETTEPLKLTTTAAVLALVTATEFLGWMTIGHLAGPPLFWLGGLRLVQIGALVWIVARMEKGLAVIGWQLSGWRRGLWQGAIWSAGFGLFAGCAMAVMYWTDRNPLAIVQSPLPAAKAELAAYLLVGGCIAPVAEELCFRGILYTYFRQWGIVPALLGSTVIFVALHSTRALPVTQIVGGIVFAVSYECSRNLMVPMTIHALGNLAIFSLSLL